LPGAEQLLGFGGSLEQLEDRENDIVVYSFNKIVSLLTQCNPNTLELLGVRDCDVIFEKETARTMRENQEKFLSKRVIYTIGGYARAQLIRLRNFSLRREAIEVAGVDFKVSDLQRSVYTDSLGRDVILRLDIDGEDAKAVLISDVTGLGFAELADISKRMNEMERNYSKLNHRNTKPDMQKLNKHAMHIVRLLYMGIDILTEQKVVTYREKERDLLLSIRAGDFMEPAGLYGAKFGKLVDELEAKYKEAQGRTELPDEPNIRWINDFVLETNLEIVRGLNCS
jgi:predicted nucleotidyltransferase